MSHEISSEAVGEVRIISDMHERKVALAQEADTFIACPEEDDFYVRYYNLQILTALLSISQQRKLYWLSTAV